MLKKIILAIGLLFLAAQFFRAPINKVDNPEVYLDGIAQSLNMPDNVHAIHKKACYDCHTDHTNYPWYNSITPINHWMYSHVRVGKKQLDYSTLPSKRDKGFNHKLEEIIEELEKGKTERFLGMPLYSYKWTHKDARLTDEEIIALQDWARAQLRGDDSVVENGE